MNTRLELIRAGAGSGKTTDLCETVVEAVNGGLDPARILATTYTRKAAAELRGRIQAELLDGSDGSAVDSKRVDRLDLAAFGTVHSVARQLLNRFALDVGLSPRLDVMEGAGADKILIRLFGTIPVAVFASLRSVARRLGMENVRDDLIRLLQLKRENRIDDDAFRDQMVASAERLCAVLAPDGAGPLAMDRDRLLELRDETIGQIDTEFDTTNNTRDAVRLLRRLGSIAHWEMFARVADLKTGAKSGDAVDEICAYVGAVRLDPSLHDDIREFNRLMAEKTIEVEHEFTRFKEERGLLDYTDLEIRFLDLLENRQLAERLSQEFNLVLVDEFQDTNPLQLAIFQKLRELADRNRWVGDPNQAIYGFRNTDPELVNRIWDHAGDAQRDRLPNNYRSRKGLVQLVGKLFSERLGSDVMQEPVRQDVGVDVERWVFQDVKNIGDEARAVAAGIEELLDPDRNDEPVSPGDVAILHRTNYGLNRFASALKEREIPYVRKSPGLFQTREGALALAGMRVVADRWDSMAAATIVHLLSDASEETPGWLADRLREVAQNRDEDSDGTGRRAPWADDPRFEPLEAIDAGSISPLQVAACVIDALDLPDHVPSWGDPARRNSNLDSVLRHACKFEDEQLSIGDSPTLTGLIRYLEELIEEEEDHSHPAPGHDAVTLSTYHSAKGLEWPVVVLTALDEKVDPDVWSARVTGGADDIDEPLASRTIHYWPWPFGSSGTGYGRSRPKGAGLKDDGKNSDEGQALFQRESQEAMRLLYVGCTRARDRLIFAHRDGKDAWLSELDNVDVLLNPDNQDGVYPIEDVACRFRLRSPSGVLADDHAPSRPSVVRWLEPGDGAPPAEMIQRFHSPSQAPPDTSDLVVGELQDIGTPIYPKNVPEDQYDAIGNAVHAYFAALPSVVDLDDAAKQSTARRCLEAHDVDAYLDPDEIVASGDNFVAWVDDTYPGATWRTEVPMCAPRAAGGDWMGTVDLLLSLPDDRLVVIDHKSAPLRRDLCEEKAKSYAGQLSAYAEAVRQLDHRVSRAFINFACAGVTVPFIQTG